MDNSQWFNQAAEINGSNNDNVGNRVDLTLKLGLPDCDQLGQYVHPASVAPNHLPSQLSAQPNTQNQGMNLLGMANQGAPVQGQQSLNGSQCAWRKSDQKANNVHNMNCASGFNQFSGPSLGFPSYNSNSRDSFAPTLEHGSPSPVPPIPNRYTLIDVPPRRALLNQHQRELGSSSASASGNRVRRRQRGGNYHDPYKRCTNYNCNTNDTPMWRKGPLGPKTLCNACGIKYRKEEEKRRAAASRG